MPTRGVRAHRAAWLGVLGSGVAYLIYFRLIRAWGATRTAAVTYLMPVVGIALGVVVGNETLDLRVVAGTAARHRWRGAPQPALPTCPARSPSPSPIAAARGRAFLGTPAGQQRSRGVQVG